MNFSPKDRSKGVKGARITAREVDQSGSGVEYAGKFRRELVL
jgi:hypothetical protein